ncbi:hypothetical protein JT359_15955 [Candidatus Poribacteria bacterium]|nr:hypothetical protein [Candidatus Poribacteria bacterium]
MTNTITLTRINSNLLAVTSFILICVMLFLTVQPALAQQDAFYQHEFHPCNGIYNSLQLAIAASELALAAVRMALKLRDAAAESGSELALKVAQKALELALEVSETCAELAVELLEDLEDCIEDYPGPWHFYVASGGCESGGCVNV